MEKEQDFDSLVERAKKILSIDKSRLDEEWVTHASTFFLFEMDLVEAKANVDRAKATLDLQDANLEKAIRLDPDNYQLTKVTEASVQAAVLSHRKHQIAYEELTEAKRIAGILQGAVNALDHKKKSLENLVSLHLAGYYAQPTLPKGAARDRMEEVSRKTIRKPVSKESLLAEVESQPDTNNSTNN